MASNIGPVFGSGSSYTFGPGMQITSGVTPSLSVGGLTVISASDKKIVIGEPDCEVEVVGNLTVGASVCAMCKAAAPLGVLLSGAATRVLFCFKCAKEHLHGSVKELVESLDIKDELGKTT